MSRCEPVLPSPLTELRDERLGPIRLYLKRDDLVHPELPGNKWRKLRDNLTAAREAGHTRLLTFGGAYSHHVRATAIAGRRFGFDTIGVIRGEEHRPLNDSLAVAAANGMRLTYLDRSTYRRKTEPAVLDALLDRFGPGYVLPEGGANAVAVRACAELPAEIDLDADLICCASGTGTTLAGIAAGLRAGQRALGFAVLRGGRFLDADVPALQRAAFGASTDNWSVEYGCHFGGYARSTPALDAFVADFQQRHGIALDRVYEAKLLAGLFAQVEQGLLPAGTNIVAVLG